MDILLGWVVTVVQVGALVILSVLVAVTVVQAVMRCQYLRLVQFKTTELSLVVAVVVVAVGQVTTTYLLATGTHFITTAAAAAVVAVQVYQTHQVVQVA
jgi:hypothetical protein